MMRSAFRLVLVAVLLAGACAPQISPPTGTAPSSTSRAPLSPAPAGTVEELLDSMERAVLARDREAYLLLVDPSDPVFALEHGRWADEWATRNPVRTYSLDVADVVTRDGGAVGELTVTWAHDGEKEPRTATFAAQFAEGPDGWRYAGEHWTSTQAPHFLVLAEPGFEDDVPTIVADLPDVFEHVTTELGYEPSASLQIKEYRDGAALAANTLLSLPEVLGWNEPGEALKLALAPGYPPAFVIAHEFTHFAGFDRAGTRRSLMPWWLDEGIAVFVAEKFGNQAVNRDYLREAVGWYEAGELQPWSELAVFEETPRELWRFAYGQGYALVRYVTDTYGRDARNAWLASMATELTIDAATPTAFGVSFDDLDRGFRDWLALR
jgi:hypothetical protein